MYNLQKPSSGSSHHNLSMNDLHQTMLTYLETQNALVSRFVTCMASAARYAYRFSTR